MISTRMHSSRMRTARSLPYRGGLCRGGVSLTETPWTETPLDRDHSLGHVTCRACWDRDPSPPWTEFLTHACEKHYLAATSLRAVIILKYTRYNNFTNNLGKMSK